MLAVFVVESIQGIDAMSNPVLLPAVIIVGLLVIARQAVSIVENRATIEAQRDLLVTTISHELRTPLTSIVGYVDLLAEGPHGLDDEQLGMLSIIHEQAGYMSTIVSDLIMLARGTDGGLELDLKPVILSDLVQASIHASSINPETVEIECAPGLAVFVDRARAEQVLVNLLTNAARYGGTHRLVRIVSKGSDVIIEVHDSGPGVPRRHEVRVWDRFERGPNRLNASIPGSGIGLAVVRAIAEAHGGSTAYRTSEVLGGACFSVVFPGRSNMAALQPVTKFLRVAREVASPPAARIG
jgi:signal transduction histidine kinase